MLLADSFKESTTVLARALVARSQTDSSTVSKPTAVAIAAQEREAIVTAALNQRISNMETRLGKVQSNMEACQAGFLLQYVAPVAIASSGEEIEEVSGGIAAGAAASGTFQLQEGSNLGELFCE